MHIITQDILATFEEAKDPIRANQMKEYMRGQFEYFGLVAPLRKDLSKIYLRELPKEGRDTVYQVVRELWRHEYREVHYVAQEMLLKVSKKMMVKEDLKLINEMITTHSWWDTIDFIAPKICKVYFDKFPEERDAWIEYCIASDHIWLQRSALLVHLKQKEEVDFKCMFATILRLNHTKEFFLNKAIGWLLREYSKKHPQLIEDFIEVNKDSLSNLSIREGSKYL